MSFVNFNLRRALRNAQALGLGLSLAACGTAPASDVASQEGISKQVRLSSLTSLVPQTAGVPQFTQFNPAADGFQFVNDFQNVFGPAETGGLCGGMAYSALDYFNAKMTIPQQSYRPEENTPLQSYIYSREETSLENNASTWASWAINPLGVDNTAILANTFAQQVGLVVASVNQGIPIPLGLDGTNGTGSHQVLAVGYNVDANQNDTQIFLYDPNHPGEMVTLVFDTTAQVFTIAEYPLQDQWVGFFADTNYSAQTPPTVPEPVYANDGLIHELFIVVGTGNNALQNGANAALEIGLTNGTTLSLSNLNLGEKWVPKYTETVRYVLPTALNPEHEIASIALSETDDCGPWDVTSTLVQAVGSGTWVLATGVTEQLGCGTTNEPLSIVQTPPTVTSVTPPAAPPGTAIAIAGTGFHTDGSTLVTFGGVAASTSCASPTACTAIVPAGSGLVALTLSEPVLDYSANLAHPPAPLQTFSAGGGDFIFPPPPPGCVPTSTCGSEYFPAGTQYTALGNNLRYLPINADGSAAVGKRRVGQFAPFTPNAGYPGTTTAGVFDTAASATGSVQAIRACAVANGVTTCDSPSNVTIVACPANCTPITAESGCTATGGEVTSRDPDPVRRDHPRWLRQHGHVPSVRHL